MACPVRSASLLDHFSALEDPRQGWRVVYPLPEILLLVLCATLAGMEDFVEIRLWGDERLDFLRRFLPYERGMPATTRSTMSSTRSTRSCSRPASRPGWKAARRRSRHHRHRRQDLAAHPRAGQGSRAAASRLRLGDPPAPRARPGGDRREVQRNRRHSAAARTARAERRARHHRRHGHPDRDRGEDRRGGGDYLLALKENRPLLQPRSTLLRRAARRHAGPPHETTDGDHGRIEQRRHVVCHDVDWLFSDRRYPDEPRFPDLAMIGMVESRVERGGLERSGATISPRRNSTPDASPPPSGPTGASRTDCTGCSTSSSTTISPGSEQATGPRTWPSSNTWP